jgi:SpoVK/Ycf46/Vps4 family AAA+-type ATPase
MLDGVITKYMGETAAKLRLIFDAVQSTRGVYLFDEVDALATSRGADNDIGEARRMLNSLLQFLDEDSSGSILIAATNHPGLLDAAIFRRFDAALVYQHPTSEEVERILRANLPQFKLAGIDWEQVTPAAVGLSQADLAAAAKDAARHAVLDNDGVIETSNLAQAITDRAQLHANSTT